MKKKKQEQQINYLDLIPVKAEGLAQRLQGSRDTGSKK